MLERNDKVRGGRQQAACNPFADWLKPLLTSLLEILFVQELGSGLRAV